MKKNVIILALCAGLMSGMVTTAERIEIVPDTQSVNFYDTVSPNTLGICLVVKKGESIDENSNVYALENAISNADGEIKFSFIMPEEKNNELSDGEYDIYIKKNGKMVKQSDVFVYASLESRTRLMNSVTQVNQGDFNALKSILENADNLIALKAIGCRTEHYNENVAAGICGLVSDLGTITEKAFKDAYNTAAVADKFGDVDKDEADKLLKIVNPEFEDVCYKDIDDVKLSKWLSEYFSSNEYSDKEYKIANILYKFNTFVADKFDDLFDEYDKDLEITEDKRYVGYTKLKSKSKANGKLAEALLKNPAKTVEELLKEVNDAVEAASKNSGGGGSGGGGGSFSASSTPIASGIPVDTQVDMGKNPSFKDLNDATWAKDAIVGLAKTGIVSGDENGNFRPNDYISREEYVTMLVLAANKYNENAECEFSDVPENAWFYSYVASANEYGVTHGISEKEFGIGYALTRQDMAVLSLRAKGDVVAIRDMVAFADDSEIADYARDAVSKLYMAGTVSGTGNGLFNPHGRATRAECAQIIFNLFLK